MNPSPDQIRSRQTAMVAERHWWASRVEAIRELAQRQADSATGESLHQLQGIANALDDLITERPSR